MAYADLPVSYNENTLVLLVQNPVVIFAYWELSAGQWRTLAAYGEPRLRLYRHKGDPCRADGVELTEEVVLPPYTDNWYFKNLKPSGSYYSELGYYGPGGMFYPLLRSNRVETPRVGAGGERADRWITVETTLIVETVARAADDALPGSMVFYRRENN